MPGSKLRLVTAVATFLALVLAGIPASAQDSKFYVGGALGGLHLDFDFASQVASARPDDPVPPSDASSGLANKWGGRIFAGWRITPQVALEIDYVDLGKVESSYVFYDPVAGPFGRNYFQRDATYRTDGFGLSVVGSLPMGEKLAILGRAGIIRSRIRYEEIGTFWVIVPPLNPSTGTATAGAVPSPRYDSPNLTQTRPVLALGVDYRISDRLSLRGEWARYFGIGETFDATLSPSNVSKGKFDLDLFSLGVTWGF